MPATALAFAAYHFNIFAYGIRLLPHLFNLLFFSFTIGIFTAALILRYSTKIEILAWSFAALLQPVAAVYYPVAVLPPFLQPLARALPVSHVFEAMRSVLRGETFAVADFFWAAGLNFVYFILAMLLFRAMFLAARRKGVLVKME